MQNPAVVVKARPVGAVAKDKDKAVGPAAGKAKDRAEEVKKSIMGMHLTPNPLKGQGLVDQSGAPLRDANPSIKDPESPEIRAKASDFTQDLA